MPATIATIAIMPTVATMPTVANVCTSLAHWWLQIVLVPAGAAVVITVPTAAAAAAAVVVVVVGRGVEPYSCTTTSPNPNVAPCTTIDVIKKHAARGATTMRLVNTNTDTNANPVVTAVLPRCRPLSTPA